MLYNFANEQISLIQYISAVDIRMAQVEDDSRWDYDCPQYIDFTMPLPFNDGADQLFEQGLIGEGPSGAVLHATVTTETTGQLKEEAENIAPAKEVLQDLQKEEPQSLKEVERKPEDNSVKGEAAGKMKERKPNNLICSLEEWRRPGKHASSGPDESSDEKKPRRSAEKAIKEIVKMVAPKVALQRTGSLRLQKSCSASLLSDAKINEKTNSETELKPGRNHLRGLSAERARSNSVTQLKKENGPPKGQKVPHLDMLAGPQCLKKTMENTSSKVKTTEELELERIEQLKKELKHKRQLAQESYKKAIAGSSHAIRPAHNRELTVPQEFHFHTDTRIKAQTKEEKANAEEKTVADFVKTLRSRTVVSPDPTSGRKACTLPQPFHLTENNKTEHSAAATKFESMAEKITAFHKRTPERFHFRPRSVEKAKVKRAHLSSPTKLTIPRTPNLQCRDRHRPVRVVSQKELEEMEIEEMKKNQFKARPVNEKILNNPHCGGKKVPPKPPTKPEEFALSCNQRNKHEGKDDEEEVERYEFHAKPLNKKILEGPLGIKPVQPALPTVPKSPAFALKNRVRIPLELPEEKPDVGQTQKAKPVPHMGIPFRPTLQHQHTIPEPFTVELRSKAMLAQREEKIKQALEEERRAREFHAQPLPSLEPDELPFKMPREPTKPEPFVLETDVRGSKYSQEIEQKVGSTKLKEEEEELKKAVVFKAQPNSVIYKEPFLPAKSTKPLTEVSDFELNSDRRAVQREEFELRKKEREAELEGHRRLREQRQKEEEEVAIAKLRAEMVHQPNPIRRYAPVVVKPSDKPLTEAESPRFSDRLRAKVRL